MFLFFFKKKNGSKVFVESLVVRNAPFLKCVVPVLALLLKGQSQVLLVFFWRYPWLFFGVTAGYHLGENNYSFDALQAYCFGIN